MTNPNINIQTIQTKRYPCMLLDPAWPMQQKTGSRGAGRHYPLLTLDQIKSLPVASLADPDSSHCWLWVTNAALRYGYEVLEAWGFTPMSILTWVKPRYGLGQYIRNASEHILLGVRGNAPAMFHGQSSWFMAPLQRHSEKPQEIYDIIERISPGPRLELFARKRRHGWDAWGLDVPSDIFIPRFPVPTYTFSSAALAQTAGTLLYKANTATNNDTRNGDE